MSHEENMTEHSDMPSPGQPVQVTIGMDSVIDPQTGALQSKPATILLDPAELARLIARDSAGKPLDILGSYVHTEAIVGRTASRKLTNAVLARDLIRPGHDRHTHNEGITPLRAFRTDKHPYVGTDLSYKWQPGTLPKAAKNPTFNDDPEGLRRFVGDEFPRMLCYGAPTLLRKTYRDAATNRAVNTLSLKAPAKPAFWSHFFKINEEGEFLRDNHNNRIPIENFDDLKGQTFRINIATKVPDYMKTGIVGTMMKARKDSSFKGQSFEEAFEQITDKVERVWRRFAEDFEQTTGLHMDVRKDTDDTPHKPDEVNISVAAFHKGDNGLAGFAAFPVAMNDWEQALGIKLGAQQGFMLLNHEYTNNPVVDDAMLYDLIAHEFGHAMGMVHPHDLGEMKMSQADAVNHTIMAYTDGKFTRFRKKTDRSQREPGREQTGLVAGVVDMSIRRYFPEAPKLNTTHHLVYDLAEQAKIAHGENYNSTVVATTEQLPAVPIICNGTGTELVGTTGNDILDTEPGHMCRTFNPMGMELRFGLVEGHFSIVRGRAGNNHIFASSTGSQTIFPGGGKNSIHIYAPDIGNTKTIHSTGKDTLILHEDVFVENTLKTDPETGEQTDHRLQFTQQGKDIIVTGHRGGKIVLKDQLEKDKGITSIRIVNDDGHSLLQTEVRSFTGAEDFQQVVVDPMTRKIPHILETRKAREEAAKAEAGGDDGHGHGHDAPRKWQDPYSPMDGADNDNRYPSHAQRVKDRRESRQDGPALGG